MKLFFILIFCLFFSSFIIGQQKILSIENGDLSVGVSDKEIFSLSNKETNEIVLLVLDNKKLYSVLFDENFKQLGALKTDSFRKKYNYLKGYSITNENYNLVFSNFSEKRYEIISLNFNTGSTSTKVLDLVIKGEEFIETISYNNRFFILTTKKNSDVLTIRELANNSFEKKEINFDGEIKLYYLLHERNDEENIYQISQASIIKPIDVSTLTSLNLNTIELTSKLNKIYTRGNSIILSFDNINAYTLLYNIDLENFTLSKRKVAKEGIIGKNKKSNSLIFEDVIFQIKSSKEKMVFTIKDFKTGLLKQKYEVTKDVPISIKNSPVIQVAFDKTIIRFKNKKDGELTSKFLKVISQYNLGISVYRLNDLYQLKIGGSKDIKASDTGIMMGNASSLSPPLMLVNNIQGSYSIFIYSIFDSHFNHFQGEKIETIFDKISEFKDSIRITEAEISFSNNGKYYFGYFDIQKQDYNIYQFTNN